MNNQEVWKDVKNYEGHYQVSSIGRVKSLKFGKERILKNGNRHGYNYVELNKCGKTKNMTNHQLVAESFLNHTICGMILVVNHINFIKNDNRVENLEIITQKENSNHKPLKC